MENIAVSVIVPVYNVELYLDECLQSLERQTLKNIEVILVNDGSTDGSELIAQKYAERNANFYLIQRENGGLSVARNTGLAEARGEYIYFLDSDDYLLDDALEKLYNKASREELDVLKFVAYTFTDSSRDLKWTVEGGYKYKGEYPNVYSGQEVLQKFIDNKDTGYPSCCLILTKREVIEKNKLAFCEGILHEDNLFHWQLLSLSKRVAILNEPLYCRRYREGSITQTPNYMKKTESMCISAETADEFLNTHPEIQGSTSEWYIMFFIRMMQGYWEVMPVDLKRSMEYRDYLQRAKKIAKKYNYGGSISTRLFFTNKSIYRLYGCIVKNVKRYHK